MADDDTLVLQLAGDLKALKARLNDELEAVKRDAAGDRAERDELVRVVGDLAAGVEDLREQLGTTSGEFLTAPWWWPRMTAEEARSAWDIIRPWVDDLVDRYDSPPKPKEEKLLSGPRLRACWFAHDDVLDALSALYWAWLGAYKTKAPAISPIEWQERWLPQTFQLAEKAQGQCASGCPQFGRKKPNEITTLDRDAFIARDVKSPDRPAPTAEDDPQA